MNRNWPGSGNNLIPASPPTAWCVSIREARSARRSTGPPKTSPNWPDGSSTIWAARCSCCADRPSGKKRGRSCGRPRGERVVSLADFPTSIGLTKAAVRSAELLVTTDSGPRHFARPFAVPVVTLFGPTHQAWSETDDPHAVHLQIKVDCGPCQLRKCPLIHHRCMRDLSIERAYDAVISQLVRHGRRLTAA